MYEIELMKYCNIPLYGIFFLTSQKARIGKRSPFYPFASLEQEGTLCCGGNMLVPPNFLEKWAKHISGIACTMLEYFEALSCPVLSLGIP